MAAIFCLNIRNAGNSAFCRGVWFESDIDMSLSNRSIGADAPAAAFGKNAALEDAG